MDALEIVASWYEGQFNLVDQKAAEDLIAAIESALTERTERCARYLDEAAEECSKEGDERYASYTRNLAESIRTLKTNQEEKK